MTFKNGMHTMKSTLLLIVTTLVLAGCLPEEENAEEEGQKVRGLKTVLVSENERSVSRRFPSVLQPSELTSVGFEMGGRLGVVDLRVGQTVSAGDILAQLDRTELDIQIASAEAAVEQARVAAQNAAQNLSRQEDLLARGTVTKVAVDNARADSVSKAQAQIQTERALDSARERADDTDLLAPFDGVISAVNARSFETIAAGAPVATLYRADGFEVSFTVNYDTVTRLAVGKPATLRLADAPDRVLQGVVTELGASADTVSSFPVVIAITGAAQGVKSGMAVEVTLEFELPAELGYTIPIGAAVFEGTLGATRGPSDPVAIKMFVYDSASQTVQKREVMVAGVRENSVLVISGLEAGERVATAGVSFLTDGQSVTLLED